MSTDRSTRARAHSSLDGYDKYLASRRLSQHRRVAPLGTLPAPVRPARPSVDVLNVIDLFDAKQSCG